MAKCSDAAADVGASAVAVVAVHTKNAKSPSKTHISFVIRPDESVLIAQFLGRNKRCVTTFG